jgi:hypothetical protein
MGASEDGRREESGRSRISRGPVERADSIFSQLTAQSYPREQTLPPALTQSYKPLPLVAMPVKEILIKSTPGQSAHSPARARGESRDLRTSGMK